VNTAIAPTPAASSPSDLSPEQRAAALQKRTLRVLLASQVAGSAGISVAVTVGGLIVKSILGKDTFAGSASATVTLGGALASLLLASYALRRGRRPSLMTGYLIALFGCVVTIVGAEKRSLLVFLVGLLFFGVGQGTNLMARYAASDLALPDERGRAVSLLLFGSTFGAVSAQILAGWCGRMGEKIGLWKYSGPFVFSGILLVFAAANTYVRLRPDPLVIAGGLQPDIPALRLPPLGHAIRVIRRSPIAKLALIAMMIAQASMVGVMTMTPIHMADHGQSGDLRGYVIALHVFGMYGFAPLIGRFSDRARLPVLLQGSVVLVLATLVSALAGYRPSMLFAGLFLLGLGWSGCLIAGSAMLVDSVSSENRVQVQGYHVLAQLGMVACALLFLAALRVHRRGASARVATVL
jgi:MFS family permease